MTQEEIFEVVVTTADPMGVPHTAPMGIRKRGDLFVVSPFRPSQTLDNLIASRTAAVNYTDDVRVFAGCVLGRQEWPLAACERISAPRLAESLAHCELELVSIEEDPTRPWLFCRPVYEATHAPFRGFNRAQSAVLEAAILASRLDLLPRDKIAHEVEYLRIAIDKTAGPRERGAWGWLMERIGQHLVDAETDVA